MLLAKGSAEEQSAIIKDLLQLAVFQAQHKLAVFKAQHKLTVFQAKHKLAVVQALQLLTKDLCTELGQQQPLADSALLLAKGSA